MHYNNKKQKGSTRQPTHQPRFVLIVAHPRAMVKAIYIVGAIGAFTAVDAFVPMCSRVVVPSARASAVRSSSMMSLGSLPVDTSKTTVVRSARTELFSTLDASTLDASDDQEEPVALPVKTEGKAPVGTLKVTAYFGLWYLFNIGYNIYNKRVLNVLPLPWIIASTQLGIGLLYVFPLWATKLRKAPKLAEGALKPLRYGETICLIGLYR